MKLDITSRVITSLASLLFFIMFVYSGINKCRFFSRKVKTLSKKLSKNTPRASLVGFSKLAMSLVIILEIFGSIYLISYICFLRPKYISIVGKDKKRETITNILKIVAITILALFVIFLILATAIYHPPTDNKLIPFLSNLTTLGGILFIMGTVLL